MGLVGRYIDALSDEQKDRIIEATSWSEPSEGVYVDKQDPSCRCLAGHAENWYREKVDHTQARPLGIIIPKCSIDAAIQFPNLQDHFGVERIIRVCKARAAKGNRIPTEALRHEDCYVSKK